MAKIALNDSDVFPAFGLEEKTMLAQLRKDINHYVDEKNSQIIKKEDIFGNRYGVVFTYPKSPTLKDFAMLDDVMTLHGIEITDIAGWRIEKVEE